MENRNIESATLLARRVVLFHKHNLTLDLETAYEIAQEVAEENPELAVEPRDLAQKLMRVFEGTRP